MTNAELIRLSLRALGVISEVENASAEQGSHALTVLNQMLESWTENDIELGYFEQTSTSDDCPIPKWAEQGVWSALAVFLAPTYGANVSTELQFIAERSYGMISRKSILEKMQPNNMDHLPRGSGHTGGWDIENG